MCAEAMSICCVLSSVERTMQSLVLCGPVKQSSKQTDLSKHRGSKLSVNAPTLKLKADRGQSQNKCTALKKRLRAPLTLVIPSSITDDSTGDVALRRPIMQSLCVPEDQLRSVEGVCPPSKCLVL